MQQLHAQFYYAVFEHVIPVARDSFKELLEKKHLYQSLNIVLPDAEGPVQALRDYFAPATGAGLDPNSVCQDIYRAIPNLEWGLEDPHNRRLPFGGGLAPSAEVVVSLMFAPATIKVYCASCEGVEAFNFDHGADLLASFREHQRFFEPTTTQVFALSYQCQACKGLPEAFMVRRQGLKLTLCGRSPMEKVVTPKFIPKAQAQYFSDAIVAFNSGQVLAGNFLLRTFIEQYVREVCNNRHSRDIEALFEAYSAGLPDDFRQRFPSLKHQYDLLSDDIHSATASETAFSNAIGDLEQHFDARRLYKLG